MGNSVEQVGCAKGETEKVSRGETRLDAAMSWTSNLVGKRVSLVVAAQADRKIELSFVALEADMGSFAALAFASTLTTVLRFYVLLILNLGGRKMVFSFFLSHHIICF